MDLLTTNLPPLRLKNDTFLEKFDDFLDKSIRIDIAVGYITADSLAWFYEVIKSITTIETLNLVIGMHYWDKFTEREYKAASEFNDFLHRENRGTIKLVKTFKYHGKLYSWSNENGVYAGIIGSDNLGSLIEGGRSYEVSSLFNKLDEAIKIKNFIDELTAKTTVDLYQYIKDERGFRINANLLEGHSGVAKEKNLEDVITTKTKTSFDIPLKGVASDEPPRNRDGSKSNLNPFFGKGRETPNKRILPRPWYEVELIPGKAVTSLPGYPCSKKPFTVITDDGWKFQCQVQGGDDGKKNFRSAGDLQILGKWIKGRMEDAGVLDVGHIVTTDTIRKFGKSIVKLTKTSQNNTWFLEFGVK